MSALEVWTNNGQDYYCQKCKELLQLVWIGPLKDYYGRDIN